MRVGQWSVFVASKKQRLAQPRPGRGRATGRRRFVAVSGGGRGAGWKRRARGPPRDPAGEAPARKKKVSFSRTFPQRVVRAGVHLSACLEASAFCFDPSAFGGRRTFGLCSHQTAAPAACWQNAPAHSPAPLPLLNYAHPPTRRASPSTRAATSEPSTTRSSARPARHDARSSTARARPAGGQNALPFSRARRQRRRAGRRRSRRRRRAAAGPHARPTERAGVGPLQPSPSRRARRSLRWSPSSPTSPRARATP